MIFKTTKLLSCFLFYQILLYIKDVSKINKYIIAALLTLIVQKSLSVNNMF